jgi:hypothetical protein
MFVPRQIGAERSTEPGDHLACGLVADEPVEGGGDPFRVGGHAVDLAVVRASRSAGSRSLASASTTLVSGTGRSPSASSNSPGVRPVSIDSAMPPM